MIIVMRGTVKKYQRWLGLLVLLSSLTLDPAFGAALGGKPEKSDVVVTYAQPSGAFTPIWVAYEAELFKKMA